MDQPETRMKPTHDIPENPLQAADALPPPNPEMAHHSRRAFLFKLSLLLNAAVGAVLAVPLVGYLLGPAMRTGEAVGAWVPLGNLEQFQNCSSRRW